MEKQFRDASFMIFKVALRDNKRTVRDIKDVPADTTADKQRKIDMIKIGRASCRERVS